MKTKMKVFFFLLMMTRVIRGEMMMPMQQLPREELVRLAGYGEEKLSSVLITGTVVCESACSKGIGLQFHDSHVAGSLPHEVHRKTPCFPSCRPCAAVARVHNQDDCKRAKVSVACKTQGKRSSRKARYMHATTDEYGEFMIDVPSHLHAIPKLEKSCIVRVLHLPKNSPCHDINLRRNPRKMRLSSVGNGIRVYTAGTLKINNRVCLRRREDGMESTW